MMLTPSCEQPESFLCTLGAGVVGHLFFSLVASLLLRAENGYGIVI
jgi:hypothetical protein